MHIGKTNVTTTTKHENPKKVDETQREIEILLMMRIEIIFNVIEKVVSFPNSKFRLDFDQVFSLVEINNQLSIAMYIQRLFGKKQLRFENYSETT